jgi:hypothetical protein
MICPHCGVGVKFEYEYRCLELIDANDILHHVEIAQCPECNGIIVEITIGTYYSAEDGENQFKDSREQILFPLNTSRVIHKEVPSSYRNDFLEACNVLPISPKASAALSRRILQHILHDEYKIIRKNLVEEIEDFLKNPNIPSYVKDAVDAVRNYGNFAAHPTKDSGTGEIVDVEEGEAEWLIEVVEALFDITFVQPKRLEEKQKQLNEKLSKVGKPPMKKS